MALEAILVGMAVAVALFPLLIARRLSRVVALVIVMVVGSATSTVMWLMGPDHQLTGEAVVKHRPIQEVEDGYVSSDTCRACHPQQYATWHDSYHRTMTQVATPDSVVGRFDGSVLEGSNAAGQTVRFRPRRDGDVHWIDCVGFAPLGDGRPLVKSSAPIALTTGSHHMQVYWLPSGQGRTLTIFPFIYLIDDDRWVRRESVFLGPDTGRIHHETGRWNGQCINCHTTRGRPRKDKKSFSDTKVGEFGIACESCHGPAEQHVSLNWDPRRRYDQHLNEDKSDTSIVNPNHLDPLIQSDVCGQCHSIWSYTDDAAQKRFNTEGSTYRPGQRLNDSQVVLSHGHVPTTLGLKKQFEKHPDFMLDFFWSDGMVRVSGREYNGLIKSPCFTHGDKNRGIMSCLSCHTMHQLPDDPRSRSEWTNDQLTLGMDTNRACMQCHEGFETEAQLVAHTNHAPDSPGSLCYNCHMPYTTYGLLKAMRSHEVSSPTVQESLETGRPNACNQCHLDRTLEWTGKNLAQWYGLPAPSLTEEQRGIAASVLWALKGDAGQRALMAWSMGWEHARTASGSTWMAPYLVQLLDDPYDAVRYIAQRSLRRLPGYEMFEFDFVAAPEIRALGQDKGWSIWERRTDRVGNPAILLNGQGQLNRNIFARLLGQRDNRIVDLKE